MPDLRTHQPPARRLVVAAALGLLVGAAPAWAARPVVVSGVVRGGGGMTIIALGTDGTAVRQRLGPRGAFRLALPLRAARGTTLQLLARGGRYAGPVVLRRRGRRAYETLSGRSGQIGTVVRRASWALAVKAPAGLVDLSRVAIADASGRPLGAGRLGVATMPVRTAHLGSGLRHAIALADGQNGPGQGGQGQGTAAAGSDSDHDGVPNALDLDANGNGVIDSFDPSAQASSAGLFSGLGVPFASALNANASGVTTGAIDALLTDRDLFGLNFFFDTGYVRGATVSGVHVDCGALRYCRAGDGTATTNPVSEDRTTPADVPWTSLDSDGSGFPNLGHVTSHDGFDVWSMGIHPNVGTADLHPGDTYDVVFDTDHGAVHVPTTLAPYFVTTPAVKAWGGADATEPVVYPIAADAPGTEQNPLALAGDTLSLEFWRPQRQAIPGVESGTFVDMGHLHYGLTMGGPQGPSGCPGYYTALSPQLSTGVTVSDPFAARETPLTDTAGDTVPSAGDTLRFTVDLGGCLRAAGVNPAGQTYRLALEASAEPRPGGMDRASQTVSVRFPG